MISLGRRFKTPAVCEHAGCTKKDEECDFHAKEGKETMYEDIRWLCKEHAKEVLEDE